MKTETKNLVLFACDKEILQKATQGNSELAAHLQIIVSENRTVFGARALQHSLNKFNKIITKK